ncbi:heterokaryon incompatibility protein-domain-containing protein [Pyrenochaeta sp. MPI-SDFR-AT-0127]|nr:heterokaryon incompatibility protein-domain-containing protein [Pyrenochaeta sp. MPI-SDFR-AT-0127]
MINPQSLSTESIEAWDATLKAAAKPARYPHFPELTLDGKWKEWSQYPDLPSKEPTSVEQPPWARSLKTSATEPPRKFGRFFAPWKLSVRSRLNDFRRSKGIQILQHDPIPQGCVRLLKIQNAEFVNNVLRGLELVTMPVNAAPEYDALSYCWGDMRLCTGVLLTEPYGSERVYRITEDLATCLHSILQSESLQRPAFLWVDQICINQDDTSERNTQVAHMAAIYKNAARVLLWLGQESSFNPENEDLPAYPGPETGIDDHVLLEWILNSSVFARPWFSRLWVLQEVVLAKEIIVLVGPRTQSWQSLMNQAHETMDTANDNPSLLAFIESIDLLVMEIVSGCREEMITDGHINLERRLPQIAIYQQCRDPRDTVLGLLGCAGDIFPTTFADYGQPAINVFRDSARIIIDKYKSLHLLTFYSSHAFNDEEYPRWFPQWHNAPSFGLGDVWIQESVYTASCGRVHLSSPPHDQEHLDVRGKVVDTVATVVKEMSEDVPAFLMDPVHFLNIRELCSMSWPHVHHRYATTRGEHDQPYQAGGGEMWPIQFIKDVIDTMLCHDFTGTAPLVSSSESVDDVYKMILTYFSPVEEGNPSNLDYSEDFNPSGIISYGPDIMKRNLVILQSGRFALVRDAVREGDAIAILHGLSVPCVLRKVEGTSNWQILGDTFVKGVMRGEGVFWEEDEADTLTLI